MRRGFGGVLLLAGVLGVWVVVTPRVAASRTGSHPERGASSLECRGWASPPRALRWGATVVHGREYGMFRW